MIYTNTGTPGYPKPGDVRISNYGQCVEVFVAGEGWKLR